MCLAMNLCNRPACSATRLLSNCWSDRSVAISGYALSGFSREAGRPDDGGETMQSDTK
ncbi:Uncharacterised protein [Bordetella pertussis]|nr:Uncharacterised protein [Bordetella pertussis]